MLVWECGQGDHGGLRDGLSSRWTRRFDDNPSYLLSSSCQSRRTRDFAALQELALRQWLTRELWAWPNSVPREPEKFRYSLTSRHLILSPEKIVSQPCGARASARK